jgi:hypothetical protein
MVHQVSKAAGPLDLDEPLASKTSVTAYQTARNYFPETVNLLTDFYRGAAKQCSLCIQPDHHRPSYLMTSFISRTSMCNNGYIHSKNVHSTRNMLRKGTVMFTGITSRTCEIISRIPTTFVSNNLSNYEEAEFLSNSHNDSRNIARNSLVLYTSKHHAQPK